MHTRLRTELCILAALLCTTIIPAFGVLGIVGLLLAGLRVLGRAPTRVRQLAWVTAALPGPIAVVSVLFAPLRIWERGVLLLGIVLQWLPVDDTVRWVIALAIATLPLWRSRQTLGVLALVPVLHLAAARPWPESLAPVVTAAAGLGVLWYGYRGTHAQQWWCVAGLLIGVHSSAALTVLPWVLTVGLVSQRALAVWCWWALAGVLASTGAVVGAGLVVIPFLRALESLVLPRWRTLALLLLWCLVPVSGSVARLQTSLNLYGSAWSGDIVGFVDSQQQLVTQFPWLVVVLAGVVGWAVWHQWLDEVARV